MAQNLQNFITSLKVMGIGLVGIFSVTIVLILVMILLTRLFPVAREKTGER
jgi:hypothetical protein